MASLIPPPIKFDDVGRLGNRTRRGRDLEIRVTGLNVARNHWTAFNALVPGYMRIAQTIFGRLMVGEARRSLLGETGFKRAWLSGDTYKSVYSDVTATPNSVTTSTGPTTFYAPFIEFGLASHSRIGPRPFMAHALSTSLPFLVQAYADLAAVARLGSKARITSPPYKRDLEAYLRRFRAHLYSLEKRLGDLAVFAPFGMTIPGTGKFRAGALGLARVIGDVQAVMGRVVGMRFQRRLTGQVTGRLIGVGSRTVFVNQVSTARITGAERFYNRFAGKLVTTYIDQSNTFLGR